MTPATADVVKSGMPNTITLPNGEVVYDLNGEWDEVRVVTYLSSFDSAGTEDKASSKDIVKITQEGKKFVGVKQIGDRWVGKNKKAVQGELEKDKFRELHALPSEHRGWLPGKGEISEDGNEILIYC